MALASSMFQRDTGPFSPDDPTPGRNNMAANSVDASARAPADASARVSFGDGVINGPSAPALTRQPKPASIGDVNPLPTGTQLGSSVRQGIQGALNTAADASNAVRTATANVTNAITYPGRATVGFLRDANNALLGQPASPDAGQPIAGVTPTLIRRPFDTPAVDFNNSPAGSPPAPAAPVASGSQTGGGGSAPAAPIDPQTAMANSRAFMDTMRDVGGFTRRALGLDPQPTASAPTPSPAATGAATAGAEGNGPGVIVNGRQLNYGALVNGVPTFSDGSGTGAIPRTMSDQTIKALGDQLPTAPAQVSALASDVLGSTPTQNQAIAASTRPPAQPITGSRPSDADFAASDANSIANRDWRSASGTAAHNLAMEAQYGGTRRVRQQAAQDLASFTAGSQRLGDELVQGDNQRSAITAQGNNELANTALQGQNALNVTNLQGRNALAQTNLEIQKARLQRAGHPVTLDDGRLGVMDPVTGQTTVSTLPNGQPARTVVAKTDSDTKRSNQVMDDLNKGAMELSKNFMPTKDQASPSPQQITQWRVQSAHTMGLPVVTNKDTGQQLVNINGQWAPL